MPYLSKEQVQQEASLLLTEHAARSGREVTIPVPIEEILEFHLKLVFEMHDLKRTFGYGDVLGALWIAEKKVQVDASLDPSTNPKMLGRFHFTLAHEAGHWRLHRTHFLENPNQTQLFGAGGKPAFVCRSSEAKKPIEWQADYFAAHLLMPGNLLRAGWEAWRGNLDVVCLQDLWQDYGEDLVRDEVAQRARRDERDAANSVMEMFIRPLAAKFEVSAEAMRIRLEEAGLLLRDRTQLLF